MSNTPADTPQSRHERRELLFETLAGLAALADSNGEKALAEILSAIVVAYEYPDVPPSAAL